MIVAISITPSGSDPDGAVAGEVAEAVQEVRDRGLAGKTNAMFTNIEGEWPTGNG